MPPISTEPAWRYDDAPPAVAEGVGAADERAKGHRDRALAALADGDHAAALVLAVLAVESRLDEQSYYLSQLT